ncbi:13683_t:CDS:2, partial [Funneliformis geosporum]
EKLKTKLNSPEYVAVSDLIKRSDYSPALTCYDGENIIQKRRFIDVEEESKIKKENEITKPKKEKLRNDMEIKKGDILVYEHGYYLIETDKPIERNDGIILEVGDKITITPYEVEKDSKPENQNKEGECDICHKNLKPGQEGVYLGQYHGNNKDKRIHVCHDCYQSKEQEYLQNYAFIYSYELDYKGKGGTGYLKNSGMSCYASHKDPNGNILQQQN